MIFHTLLKVGLILCVVALPAFSQSRVEDAYKKILRVADDEGHKIAREELDLGDVEISRFMVAKMNLAPIRGDSPADTMSRVVAADVEKGFEWLLDHYDDFSAVGRAAVVRVTMKYNYRETLQLFLLLLDDKRVVVNDRRTETPPEPYIALRVCDHAYNGLTQRIGRLDNILPSELPKVFGPDSSYADRDMAIRQFRQWWDVNGNNITMQKPSLGEKKPAITQKLQAIESQQTK